MSNVSKHNLYNEYKVGFKSAAKSDILAIENADGGVASLARFMSADAKLHDVRGAASKVVVYHIEYGIHATVQLKDQLNTLLADIEGDGGGLLVEGGTGCA